MTMGVILSTRSSGLRYTGASVGVYKALGVCGGKRIAMPKKKQRCRMDDMAVKPCKCGGVAEEVINAEDMVRVGWYCPGCKDFDKAIARERVYVVLDVDS